MKETTYVMVKPEFADNMKVVCEIRYRILNEGLNIVDAGYVRYGIKKARKHYKEHLNEEFYPKLENYITSGKAYGMIVTGEDAIARVRYLVQKDKKAGLQEGDIRYDIPKMLGQKTDMTKNVIHASDKVKSAEKEIKIFKSLKKENFIQ